MGDIDKRIEETLRERRFLHYMMEHVDSYSSEAHNRLLARTEKRLSDLIAVRDGLAVEFYATVSVNVGGDWISYGKFDAVEQSHEVLYRIFHDSADSLTILRGIARKPVTSVDEADAESEEA